MKKLLYSLLALGTVAGLASCSSDEPMMSGNNDGKVTIEVKLPDFGTRFYGDQLQCNELIYTVYDASGNAIDGVTDVKQDAFGTGVTSETVTLNLVPGETYMVAFYAHNNGSLFSTYSNGTIDVNYEKMNVNSEIDDAFYCYKEISTTATEPQSVTLNRAFAQINFGTNDFDNALVKNVIGSLEATLTINGGLSTSLDAKTNAVSVPQSEAVTVSNTLTSNEDFPVSGYGNLTSVYVLVGGEEGEMLSTGSYVVMNGTKEVRNVNLASTPVRMNYRTNIYGSMLTTQIPVTVEIEPNFADEIMVWDGKTATTPQQDEEGNYILEQPSDLLGLIEMVNKGESFAGKTIKLNNDFDMADNANIVSMGATRTTPFSGEIDGQGNTLKGLVNPLITYADGANIHDMTVEFKQVNYAPIAIYSYGETQLTNVTSNGTKVVNTSTATHKVGAAGFIARVMDGHLTIDQCINNTPIDDSVYVAGGFVATTATDKSGATLVTIINSKNTATVQSTRASGGKAAGFIGMPAAMVEITDCQNEGEIVLTTGGDSSGAGGFIAWSGSPFTLTKCTNSAPVTLSIKNQSGIAGAGGMFGASGFMTGPITITDCVNTAAITAVNTVDMSLSGYARGLYAGGMMGTSCYGGISITGCSNSGAIKTQVPEGSTQSCYTSGMIGGFGWQTSFVFTGNTVDAATTLSSNATTSFLAAYYIFVGQLDGTAGTINSNTNATSYIDSVDSTKK